ncbi:MAG TPA: amidohydrolase, partial [Sulfurospirillum sp. UBA11407]
MNLITADFILTCNDNFEIIKDGALVFEKEILEIGEKQTLLEKYPNAKRIDSPKNSVLLPGLINPHVHLEFSANTTTLHYG